MEDRNGRPEAPHDQLTDAERLYARARAAIEAWPAWLARRLPKDPTLRRLAIEFLAEHHGCASIEAGEVGALEVDDAVEEARDVLRLEREQPRPQRQMPPRLLIRARTRRYRPRPRAPRARRTTSSARSRGDPRSSDDPEPPGPLGHLERLGLRLLIDEAVRRRLDGFRECAVCLLELPLSEFDGRRVCRACHSARVLERYRARRAAA